MKQFDYLLYIKGHILILNKGPIKRHYYNYTIAVGLIVYILHDYEYIYFFCTLKDIL